MWLLNLFKNAQKSKEIKRLNEKIAYLEEELDKYSKNDIYDFKNDFLFNNVDRIISIEGEVHEQIGLVKCTICYMLTEVSEEQKETCTYKEWYTWCTFDQYRFLYNEFLKYKENLNV